MHRRTEAHLILMTLLVAGCSGPGKATRPGTPPEATRRELTVPSTSTDHSAELATPPGGPFGLSMVASADGKPTSIGDYQESSECGECHPRQWKELSGSMHSVSHRDSLYRRTAELALKEAGSRVYGLCSGCHTPQGVASGLVPRVPEEKLPEIVKAGIVCDTCHQISKLTGHEGPWKEPGNASIVLQPGIKRGPPTGDDADADHEAASLDFYQRSEYCGSCHTVIHPTNGVRLEHTYAEWKKSVYASKGIQCQGCHMRTVEQAAKVAATLTPVPLSGPASATGKPRPIAHHYFVGGNANAALLGGGKHHGKMAEERLRSAATLELQLPARARAGTPLKLQVVVTNTGAGHNLPTSLTELREIWVDLKVKGADGAVLFHSGGLDRNGDVDPRAMRFGAKGADKDGKLTYKPWAVTHFLWKRLIPPKTAARDAFEIPLPGGASGPLTVSAELLYRSAPPVLVKALFPDGKLKLPPVKMASAVGQIEVE